jgi:hypothetical protein
MVVFIIINTVGLIGLFLMYRQGYKKIIHETNAVVQILDERLNLLENIDDYNQANEEDIH